MQPPIKATLNAINLNVDMTACCWQERDLPWENALRVGHALFDKLKQSQTCQTLYAKMLEGCGSSGADVAGCNYKSRIRRMKAWQVSAN